MSSLLGRILSMPSRTTRPEPADSHSPVVGMPSAKVWVDEDIALTYAAVWRCVSLISSTVATLPWRVLEVDDRGNKRVVEGDPIDDILHLQSNPELGAFQFKEFLLTQALTWGNGFAEIERTNVGEVRALWPIHWSRVTVKRSDDQSRYFYVVDENGENPTTIRQEDAFHLRGPTKDGFVGMSPVAHARETLGTGLSADQFAGSLYGNGVALGLLITPGRKLGKEGKADMRREIVDAYAGSRNGFRAMVLDPGMTVERGMIPPTDAQFLESRKFNVLEVCRWFNVQPHKAFDLDRASFCLPAGSMVFTSEGPVGIERVRPGDLVWSRADGGLELAPVTRSGCTGHDPILTIRTTNRTIRCNAKHPILSRRRRWSEKCSGHPTIGGRYQDGALMVGEWVTEYVPAGELRVGDTIVTLDKLPDGGTLDVCPTRVPTVGFMEFCGLLIGDGSVDRKRGKVAIARAATAAYMDHYRSVMRAEFRKSKPAGAPIRLDDAERCTRFSSRAAAEELAELGFTGTAKTKRVPGWVFQLPESHRLAFLRGFLDADGSCDKKGRLSFSSASPELLGAMRHLCMSCGVPVTNMRLQVGTTRLPDGRKVNFRQWAFTSSDPGSNRRVGSHTPHYVDRMNAGRPFLRKGRNYPRYGGEGFEERGLSLARIAAIDVGESEPVYDLTVAGSHSFVADGVVVHNSNIEHQGIDFVTDTINPWTKRLEQEGDRKLVRRVENRARRTKVQTNALMRGDTKTRGEFYKAIAPVGGLSVNDILRLEDMNTIGPVGDTRLVPLNMTTLERAAAGDENRGAGTTAAAQAREVCEDAYTRALRREARAAARADGRCDDPDAFAKWADRFYAEHRVHLAAQLGPACRLVARLCGDQDPDVDGLADAAAANWIQESRESLRGAADREAAVEAWGDRVGVAAYQLIETVAMHVAAKEQAACSTH